MKNFKTKQKISPGKIFLGTVILLVFFVAFKLITADKKNCGRWLFLTATSIKVSGADEAIIVFRSVLKQEDRYRNFDYPKDKVSIIKKFNLMPYKRLQEVVEYDGRKVKRQVYDMLLAYAISEDGDVYKYNMCRIL